MAHIEPDRAALEIAHRKLQLTASLDDTLKIPALQAVLYAIARRHMRRRCQVHVRNLQANDIQEAS